MSYESDMNRARDIVRELSAIFDRYDEEIPPGPVPPTEKPKVITSLVIETKEDSAPITWAQVFKVGDVQPGDPLMARWADGSTTQLQVDGKATHADGSLRHAIISTIAVGGKLEIVKGTPKTELGGMKTMYTHSVSIVLDGITYTASVTGKDRWLDGPIVTEYSGAAPFAEKDGKQHPHLHLRTAIRCYAGEATRFDFSIENDWAYELNPQNFTYDVSVEIGGKVVYEQKSFTHYHHARWRKVLWAGRESPDMNIRHDPFYLIDTRALSNYDLSVSISEKELEKLGKLKGSDKAKPMAVGMALPYMPNTGGRDDIGLNPGWAVSWLLSQDKRAADATLITADLAGSWSTHYRDKNTGLPISLIDYPYMTIKGNRGDTKVPGTKEYQAFPEIPKGTTSPNVHDVSHQPNLTYLAYLLTGDFYYLEELQFWGMFDAFWSNPAYRENIKGLLKSEQVRGQAWGLRSISDAAYITPDIHPLKSHFLRIIDSNLDWYIAEYVDNPSANKLGVIVNGYSITYDNQTALAPWMDDFFTSVIGQLAERGLEKAKRLIEWKSKFSIMRMVGKGIDPVFGAMYNMKVRDSLTSPLYDNIEQVFKASIGKAQLDQAATLKPNEMTGYSSVGTGYPSNMQPALSYSADFAGEDGKRAWKQFMSRSVKPDYSVGAQFAIVPRTV